MSVPGPRQQSPCPGLQCGCCEWMRFVLGYGILGLAIGMTLVWFNPQWLVGNPPPAQVDAQIDSDKSGAYTSSKPQGGNRQASSQPVGQMGKPAGEKGKVSYADSVARAAPAVVSIYAAPADGDDGHFSLYDYHNPFLDRFLNIPRSRPGIPEEQANLGSGIIFNEQGYIVTNHHVINKAERIKVVLADKREALASVIGEDPATDLAVIKIDLHELPAISFGHDTEIRVGDVVLAIGNPFGFGQTVTKGIISATGRDELGLSTFESFLQTDAAINVGNSGGALIDAEGRLIGINTALFDHGRGGSHGIGFAIPATMAQSVISDILEHGKVVRGWLGVKTQRLTPPLARSFKLDTSKGVVVTKSVPGGPVDDGTLRTGDVIVRIDEHEINSARDLFKATGSKPPGAKVEVSGYRQGKPFTQRVTLGEQPAPPRERGSPDLTSLP